MSATDSAIDFDAVMAEVAILSSAIDPSRTPFQSKYLAADKLSVLDAHLSAQLKIQGENTANITEKLCEVRYALGSIHFATEETQNALDALSSFLSLQNVNSPLYRSSLNVHHLIDANNTLCMIMFEREDYEKAEKYLKAAETAYLDFSSSTSPIGTPNGPIESAYTMTCLFFAQVYGKMEETTQSAIYCEKTLLRKYDDSGNFDPLEIAQFCLQIASYYQSERRWRQALYIIAAAYTISKSGQDSQLYGEISLFMGKLFSEYLESQRDLQSYLPDISEEVVKFKGLELDREFVASQLGGVELTALATSAQVDPWVSQGSSWFTRALHYYVLDGFTTEHVTICLERDHMLSMAIEFSSDRKAKKAQLQRRASYLEPLVKALSPNYFFSLVQQLLFTLGEIYEHMVDLTSLPLSDGLPTSIASSSAAASSKGNTSGLVQAPALDETKAAKVNKRIGIATRYYQQFLDTLMPNGQLPTQLDEGVVESFFRAHLSLAKLHQRFRSSSKPLLVAMARKSASYYKLTDTLARAYKPNVLQQELGLCMELYRLLTLKAESLDKS